MTFDLAVATYKITIQGLISNQLHPDAVNYYLKKAESEEKFEQCAGMKLALDQFYNIIFLWDLKELLDQNRIHSEFIKIIP